MAGCGGVLRFTFSDRKDEGGDEEGDQCCAVAAVTGEAMHKTL